MYDRVLVITINSYYSKAPSTGTAVIFWYRTGTAVLLRSTVPTTAQEKPTVVHRGLVLVHRSCEPVLIVLSRERKPLYRPPKHTDIDNKGCG